MSNEQYFPSFDLAVLQDQLFQTLKKSPVTSQLITLRAQEIVMAVVEKPLISNLMRENQHLKSIRSQQQENSKAIRSSHKKENKALDRRVIEQTQQINSLQLQLETMESHKEQISSLVEQQSREIDQLANQNQMLYSEKEKLFEENQVLHKVYSERHEENVRQKNKLQIQIVNLQNELQQQLKTHKQLNEQAILKEKTFFNEKVTIKEELGREEEKKSKKVEGLKLELVKYKTQAAEGKKQYSQLKSQLEFLKKKYQGFVGEYNRIREAREVDKVTFEKERKLINERYYDLNRKYMIHKKIKSSAMVSLKKVYELKNSKDDLAKTIIQEVGRHKSEIEAQVEKMLERVGFQFKRQLEYLGNYIKDQKDQIKILKQQNTLKAESLENLEATNRDGKSEHQELKVELKVKKKEEQKLRKELRRAYEESEIKYEMMEKKYRQLLRESTQN